MNGIEDRNKYRVGVTRGRDSIVHQEGAVSDGLFTVMKVPVKYREGNPTHLVHKRYELGILVQVSSIMSIQCCDDGLPCVEQYATVLRLVIPQQQLLGWFLFRTLGK